jgi:glycine cleavage system T protein (aminomethyltransferase)
MGLKTPLHDSHVEAGARIVDFGGWDMPLHYGSQIEEHHAVRRHAGMFDVSHMTVVDLHGEDVHGFLRGLLANDVARLGEDGAALYSCMLRDDGGILDDLIAYRLDDARFRLVVNAATRSKDLAWIRRHAEPAGVRVSERREFAMLAVQGPKARELAAPCINSQWRGEAMALAPFHALEAGELFVARTGYTGEDGWEILIPAAAAPAAWDRLLAAGVTACGLGARDTLRLEAAMNLYGSDMDESVTPLESGLGWTVAFDPADRAFIGREALEQQRGGESLRRFVGLLLEDRGVLRNHQRVVVEGVGEGEITSGGYSPTIDASIALARLPAGDYERAQVDVRGRMLNVRIVNTPFVRHGRVRIEV